jgi:hypothetical protein
VPLAPAAGDRVFEWLSTNIINRNVGRTFAKIFAYSYAPHFSTQCGKALYTTRKLLRPSCTPDDVRKTGGLRTPAAMAHSCRRRRTIASHLFSARLPESYRCRESHRKLGGRQRESVQIVPVQPGERKIGKVRACESPRHTPQWGPSSVPALALASS